VPVANPVADFTISPDEPTTSDRLQLLDCSRDPAGVGIAWRAWDFGDGTTAVGPAPVHRYTSAGVREVTLTLATFDGRVSRRTRIIRVHDACPRLDGRRREP
jgi:PKD repeat protein